MLLVILPFLTLITLSAIAVSAELCVIITTVMPFSVLRDWRSFNIDLPVW